MQEIECMIEYEQVVHLIKQIFLNLFKCFHHFSQQGDYRHCFTTKSLASLTQYCSDLSSSSGVPTEMLPRAKDRWSDSTKIKHLHLADWSALGIYRGQTANAQFQPTVAEKRCYSLQELLIFQEKLKIHVNCCNLQK